MQHATVHGVQICTLFAEFKITLITEKTLKDVITPTVPARTPIYFAKRFNPN